MYLKEGYWRAGGILRLLIWGCVTGFLSMILLALVFAVLDQITAVLGLPLYNKWGDMALITVSSAVTGILISGAMLIFGWRARPIQVVQIVAFHIGMWIVPTMLLLRLGEVPVFQIFLLTTPLAATSFLSMWVERNSEVAGEYDTAM